MRSRAVGGGALTRRLPARLLRRMAARRARPPLDLALAATLHDPSGALVPDLRRALPVLRRLYRHLAVATSPPTAERMVRALEAEGVHAGSPRSNTRGPLYRLSLRAALAGGAGRVHYLDFDRALHWAAVAPRELAAVAQLATRHAHLWVGRTPKAHASHHRPLFATEVVVNRLLARRLGLGGRVDLLVPSFALARETAVALLARSRARDTAVYGELVALLAALAPAPAYVECRGLDWETPDRHRRAVRRLGLAEWRRREDTAAEWARRTDVAAEILRGFERALRGGAAPRPALLRLRSPVGR